MCIRFKKIPVKDWDKPVLNTNALKKNPRLYEGKILMFPTVHDILPEFIEETVDYLHKWLEVGNQFLIVSKPNFECMNRLFDELKGYKEQILFRFTIGSIDDRVLSFWDTNAPPFYDRFRSLVHANMRGFRTSVSCEPFLDNTICRLVSDVYPFVSDTIWIGKMNKIDERVDTTGWSKNDFRFLDTVKKVQADSMIRTIYSCLSGYSKVRWKDSIKKVIGLPSQVSVE